MKTTAMSLMLGCICVTPSFAAPTTQIASAPAAVAPKAAPTPLMDVFENTTPGMKKQTVPTPTKPQSNADKIGQGALGMMSNRTPAVSWFESFDTTVFTLRPTHSDTVILTMSLNQELERVQKWTATASRVSRNYRLLARSLKNMSVPPDSPGLQEYRDFTADWYLDKAGVYDDLIRPRPPAKTMEELESDLKQVEDRAISTAETAKRLKEMDMDLRKAYHVHMSRETDPLSQYVMGSINKPH